MRSVMTGRVDPEMTLGSINIVVPDCCVVLWPPIVPGGVPCEVVCR